MPYTYLIGWSKIDCWYYGARYAVDSNPDDLMTQYFTSSKLVKIMIRIHGIPDVVEVRRLFDSSSECRDWERKVLRRLNVVPNLRWLNLSEAKGIAPNLRKKNTRGLSYDEIYGPERAIKMREKRSISNRERGPRSSETKAKISSTRKAKFASGDLRPHNKLSEERE